jgi:hypothetical protein
MRRSLPDQTGKRHPENVAQPDGVKKWVATHHTERFRRPSLSLESAERTICG